MLKITKNDLIKELSEIDDVIFVGGTSEYIQGVKPILNDIDISVTSIEDLKKFGYIHKKYIDFFYGLSGNRGLIKTKDVFIDIFIETKKPKFKLVENYKCETIESMIKLREKTLEKNYDKKIDDNLKRLKNYVNGGL